MKKIILIALAISALAGASPAMAANWTGLNINVGAGSGAWSADTSTLNNTTGAPILGFVQTQGGKGGLGKVGIGYDYQYNNNFVVGLLADYDFADLKGTIQDQGPFYAGNIKEQYSYAAGARIGWLFSPDTLTYIDGGWSRAHFSSATMVTTFAGVPSTVSTPAFNKNGWFLGLGMDTQIVPDWFLRAEYRYAEYGKTNLQEGTSTTAISFKPTVQTGSLQVVYKFSSLHF